METEHKSRKRRKRRESKKAKGIKRLVFYAYVGFMVWLLFVVGMENSSSLMMEGGHNINIIPFNTVKVYIDAMKSAANAFAVRQIFVSFAANIVLFIPLGFFLPWIWKKLRTFWKTTGVSAAIFAGVELVQLITFAGACDVDDFILNTAGAMLGYVIWKKVQKKTEK